MGEQSPAGAPAIDRTTELAFERTRIACERTLMAWIRTATSLIAFGFTIYNFFNIQFHGKIQSGIVGPKLFSEILVVTGLVSLLLATFEYRQRIRSLATEYGGKKQSMAVWLAALISVLGIISLLTITF
jgi:putative membrane protein